MFHMLYTQACFPSRCYSPETFTLQLHFVKLEKENALFLSHDQPLISVSCTLFFFIQKATLGCLSVFFTRWKLDAVIFLPAGTVAMPATHSQ